MDVAYEVKVRISFKLSSIGARDALETKITNFINSRIAGSYAKNKFVEDPSKTDNPFRFDTVLHIIANSLADVSSADAAILTALEDMPVKSSFEFRMLQTGVNLLAEE